MDSAKSIYVSVMRQLRRLLATLRLLGYFDRNLEKRWVLYLRSLLAIYDFEDLARLGVPWWTFSAINEVEKFLNDREATVRVFEYGPGASTIWLARHACSVTYVEHDEAFATKMNQAVQDQTNITGRLVEPIHRAPGEQIQCPSGIKGFERYDFVNYVEAIRDTGGPFDLIVIDGRARVACLAEAAQHLRAPGMIVFDDSNRARYSVGLSNQPLTLRRFRGLGPTIPYFEETSLLDYADVEDS